MKEENMLKRMFTLNAVTVRNFCGKFYKDKPLHEQQEWEKDLMDYIEAHKRVLKHVAKASNGNNPAPEITLQEIREFLNEK